MTKQGDHMVDLKDNNWTEEQAQLPLELLMALDRLWGAWQPERPELLVRLPYPGKRGVAHAR